MTPTINVNLKPCDCTRIGKYRGEYPHFATCSATPILLPCHIPRTVEMMVRSGECTALCSTRMRDAAGQIRHKDDCPARPIRVTCTIGGDGTWKACLLKYIDGPPMILATLSTQDVSRITVACRARWELVVALVTGKRQTDGGWLDAPTDLFTQRDAVFAAIAKMATLEHEHEAARLILPASCRPIPATGSDTPHPSADALRLYVSHLIAKVSSL